MSALHIGACILSRKAYLEVIRCLIVIVTYPFVFKFTVISSLFRSAMAILILSN